MKIITTSIIAVCILVCSVLAYLVASQQVRSSAVDSCMKGTSYMWRSSTEEKTLPDYTWFNTCLKEKGLK